VSPPVQLRSAVLPDFGVPARRPVIDPEEHRARMDALEAAVDSPWIVVYGDREHFANLAFLCGYDPRFEEALLILGPRRTLVVGLEGAAYATLMPAAPDVVVCPSLSLMGQERGSGPTLEAVLRAAGIREGEGVAIVGWKAFEAFEWALPVPAIAAPAFLVDLLRHVAGADRVVDAAAALTSPTTGLRARNSAAQLAAFEWAASRGSEAVRRIVHAARPGMAEQDAVAAMGYAGEPLSVHTMFASGPQVAVGLRSPSDRTLEAGDAVTTAIGFWGGLTSRAALLSDGSGAADTTYLQGLALPYWHAIATWYESLAIGATGGEIHAAVLAALDGAGFTPALNPGHLVHLDEWVHSPIRPGAPDPLTSGMALQCDIIPSTNRAGWVANCEDTVALADAQLRGVLEREQPDAWSRILARRAFMADVLGLDIADEVLPLSNTPAWFPPFWLAPEQILARTRGGG
jgi:hypothetical protein